jgi:hypothetical protein
VKPGHSSPAGSTSISVTVRLSEPGKNISQLRK